MSAEGGGGGTPPTGGSSSTYVAPDGSIKPLVPRNVNINQFYPQVDFFFPTCFATGRIILYSVL